MVVGYVAGPVDDIFRDDFDDGFVFGKTVGFFNLSNRPVNCNDAQAGA